MVQSVSTGVSYIKSKKRVTDHGEVFTPAWMVDAMLDLVKDESERIDSRFLEPACGSGNFLVQVLRRRLSAVELRYGQSNFEKRHYALRLRVAPGDSFAIPVPSLQEQLCNHSPYNIGNILGGRC